MFTLHAGYPKQTYHIMSISELSAMIPKIPEYQRTLNENHVNHIYNDIKTKFEKNEQPILSGVIQLVTVSDKKEFKYIIDGNHRLTAFIKYYDEDKQTRDFNIVVNEITLNTEKEAQNLFDQVNKTFPVLLTKIPSSNINIICNYFFNTYKSIFKDSDKPQRPHISKIKFQDTIKEFLEDKNIDEKYKTQNSLINKIEEFNKTLTIGNKIYEYKNTNDKKFTDIYEKGLEKKFVLGIYIYKIGKTWLKDIFNIKEKKKTNIPSKRKTEVWEKYIGEYKGLCMICNKTPIKSTEFECCHVVSEYNGGSIDISNLRPGCSSCNKSMNKSNMIDWMKKMGYSQGKNWNGI